MISYFQMLIAYCHWPPRGLGGRGGRDGSPDRLYKAPTDYTKTQPADYTKPRKSIRMHPYASNMHPYASVCTHMHPNALFTPPSASIQDHRKSQKIKKIHEFDFSIMCSGAQNRSESNPLNKFRSKLGKRQKMLRNLYFTYSLYVLLFFAGAVRAAWRHRVADAAGADASSTTLAGAAPVLLIATQPVGNRVKKTGKYAKSEFPTIVGISILHFF